MESYPIDADVGNCISSQYSGSGSSFQVADTSVTDGAAEVITGTVTASADGILTRVLSNGETQRELLCLIFLSLVNTIHCRHHLKVKTYFC